MTDNIINNYNNVVHNVAEAAYKASRKKEEIRIIAVTKFVEQARIAKAIEANCKEVGENRAQELVDKYSFFKSNNQFTHFIGQLQQNKVKYLVGRADLIQSADRLDVFSEINRIADKHGLIQNTLVEINIGDEPQKAGVLPQYLPELLKRISEMPSVCVRGLMCVPPVVGLEEQRRYFAHMRELFINMKRLDLPNVFMDELSMGMSRDYPLAVAEGATMVRIGSAIFGERHRQ